MTRETGYDPGMTDRSARNLRRVLAINAASSAGTGLAMALFAGPLGTLFVPDGGTLLGLSPATWVLATGLGLLPFAALVAVAAAMPAPPRGLVGLIVGLDGAWVAGSLLLLGLAGAALSWPAWIAILAVADIVALFAFLQNRYLRRLDRRAAQAGGALGASV